MNDWPADPRLDQRLRDLAGAELTAARADVRTVGARRAQPRTSERRALFGLGVVATIAIVAALLLRGAGRPGPATPGAGGFAGASPSAVGSVAIGRQPSPNPSASSPAASATPTQVSKLAPSIPAAAPSAWFTATGPMNTADAGPFGAVELAGGRVLVVHACDTAAELYDPATGRFTPTGSMAAVRFGFTTTLLQDGRVLVTGGYNCGDATTQAVLATAEVYDPAAGAFAATGPMSTPREYQTATLLPNGRVLIAGGYDVKSMLASAELYDPATGKFTPTGAMNFARDEHTATLLQDGRVLVAGGGGEGDASMASAEIYDPQTGRFTRTGSMSSGRWLHTATPLQDGEVLIAGGRAPTDSVYSSAELYDPATGKFSRTGTMTTARQEQSATLLPDGRVLVAGGYGGQQALASAEIYDPATSKFTTAGTMGVPRMGQSATLLTNGLVLIAGGGYIGGAGEVGLDSALLYRP
jgi:hypothetical protein